MDYNDVKELIDIINDSSLTSFELSIDNVEVKMSKNSFQNNEIEVTVPKNSVNIDKVKTTYNEQSKTSVEPDKKANKTPEISGNIVKSPIVGTFYLSNGPGKPDYVSKGSKVKQGDVLCIVEAMKIMNEIVSTYEGEISEIYVQSETLVEYGQPLFKIV